MKIALVQQHASESKEENIGRAEEAVDRAAKAGANLVAFAELGLTRFWPQFRATTDSKAKAETVPGPTTRRFSALAKQHGIVIVLNLFERQGDRTFDSSPIIDADGRLLGRTRMVHIMEGPKYHERGYYTPGNLHSFVHETSLGKIGIAICYDRHYPEYMRQLGLLGAQVVIVPQAGIVNEWPKGIFEAELQVAAFQNGYYAALVNRVGKERGMEFSGESFVVDPYGQVIARAPRAKDVILYADCDFGEINRCAAGRHFWEDRRPEFYRSRKWLKR